MKVVAPSRADETAGYLGYYTKNNLGPDFDVMDLDGCWPAVWLYRKSETGALRFFEEKPDTDVQQLKDSQQRTFRRLAAIDEISCYVIWQADKLAQNPPLFPLHVTRLAPAASRDRTQTFTRVQFDRWLLRGFHPVERLFDLPYEPPAEWPGTRDEWLKLDRAITRLASVLQSETSRSAADDWKEY